MFFSLLQFEIRYQLKQRAAIGFSVVFLLLGFIMGSRAYVPAQVLIDSNYQITFFIGLLSLGSVFPVMFFAIAGVLRDRQYGMEPIVYSTAVGKVPFFFSRFAGVLLLSLLVFSMALIGFALGTNMAAVNPDQLIGFRWSYYTRVWLIMVLPNVFIATAVVFSISSFTKSNVATYVGAVAIYALYWICSIFLNSPMLAQAVTPSPENMAIAAVADPFGLAAFFEQTQYWTPFEKNTQQVAFSGYLLWSRLLWSGIAALVLVVAYWRFSFQSTSRKAKQAPVITTGKGVAYTPVSTNTQAGQWQSFKALLRIELTNVFKSLPFIAVVLVWVVIVASEVYSRVYEGGAYNDSLYPTTNLLIWLIEDPLPFLGLLLLVFYSGEMVWRERQLQFNGIIDSTPVRSIVFFTAKAVALVLLPLVLIAISIIIAIGFQIAGGYYHVELAQYLAMFYYSGIGFLFYALLALFIQSVVANKYVGMMVTGVIIILFGNGLSSWLGIEHPLLRPGYLPYVEYTNMTGYGDAARTFHYYALHWMLLGWILALCSFKLWQRGVVEGIKVKLKQLKGWSRRQRIILGVALLLFMGSGSAIYYNTNVVNDYTTINERLDYREAYERKLKQYEALERPVVVQAKTNVAIYPHERRVELKAYHVLENISDTTIHQILVSEKEPLQFIALENGREVAYDPYLEVRLYELHPPLAPGEQLQFTYHLEAQHTGFSTNKALVNNGTYLSQTSYEPVLGYRSGLEISQAVERQQRGLPPQEEPVVTDDHILGDATNKMRRIEFETVVSTANDQMAIAPGNLMAQWTGNGRNYYHYKAPSTIAPSITYLSANYQTKVQQHKGIAIEQYYHPSHHYNINNIARYSKLTLDYCINNFGAYPFDHLRIAEIPGHWPFGGQALPGTIGMVEDRLYLVDNTNPYGFDLVAKRTIHEVAHQWWGHILVPKYIEGGSLFTEGLAKYTEAVVMEQYNGLGAIWQLSESANKRYFSGRSFATTPEPPLYHAAGESYLSYGKNYTVMLALKDLLGETQVNSALQQLVSRHRADAEPTVTSLELLDEFYRVAPPKYHVLIDDWLKRVITYDLQVKEVTVNEQNGQYEVVLQLETQRFETNAAGRAEPIAMNEPIPIGIFAQHPKHLKVGEQPLYLRPHQISRNKHTIRVVVNERPTYVAIDPFGTRSDANRANNLMLVE